MSTKKVASCGDDSNVRVSDLRCAGPSYRLDGAHDGACHTVRWHPRDVNLLLSAGLDSTMKLHDLRKLDAPLHVFRGHCPYALARWVQGVQGGGGVCVCVWWGAFVDLYSVGVWCVVVGVEGFVGRRGAGKRWGRGGGQGGWFSRGAVEL